MVNISSTSPTSTPSTGDTPTLATPQQSNLRDNLWFVPFGTSKLISAYEPHPDIPAIIAAQPFTVALKTAWIVAQPKTDFLHRLLHPKSDILILSTTTLGAKPGLQRVHYYADRCPIQETLS